MINMLGHRFRPRLVPLGMEPKSGLLVYDTFTDFNATPLVPNHTPDIDVVGAGWQMGVGGVWQITGNEAYQNAGAGGPNTVYIDAGVSDGIITCIVNCGTATAAGLTFRAQDGDDNLEYILDSVGNQSRIFSNNGGLRANIDTVVAVLAANTDYSLRIVYIGTSIRTYIDGVLMNDIVNATFLNETGVGLWTLNATLDARWDNFSVE